MKTIGLEIKPKKQKQNEKPKETEKPTEKNSEE